MENYIHVTFFSSRIQSCLTSQHNLTYDDLATLLTLETTDMMSSHKTHNCSFSFKTDVKER